MLHRIRLKNYRLFEDVELKLGPVSVVVGPGGWGKSSLLDALMLLRSMVSRQNLWDIASVNRGGLYWAANRRSGQDYFGFEVDVELSEEVVGELEGYLGRRKGSALWSQDDRLLRYSVEVAWDLEGMKLYVTDERLWVLKPEDLRVKGCIIERNKEKALLYGSKVVIGDAKSLPTTVVGGFAIPAAYPHIWALQAELLRWSKASNVDPQQVRREWGLYYRFVGDWGPVLEAHRQWLSRLCPCIEDFRVRRWDDGRLDCSVVQYGIEVPLEMIRDELVRALGLLGSLFYLKDSTLIGLDSPEVGISRPEVLGELLVGTLGGRQLLVVTASDKLAEGAGVQAIRLDEGSREGTGLVLRCG